MPRCYATFYADNSVIKALFRIARMYFWICVDLCIYNVYTNDMEAKIQKWGNSLGIRIPICITKELSLKNGSIVDIFEKSNQIVIKPKKKRSLKDLLSLVTDENIHGEFDFGRPVGKEIL